MAVELLGGRYRLERLLGRGGMGEVYRAFDTRCDRLVALKILSDTADESYARRLRREADLVKRLAHPHIVDLLDSGGSDGRLYLAMRLVDGSDLRRVLGTGPLDPHRAVRVLTQVAEALDAAHEAGIVHRDVKPANILIGPGEDAHLTDFGIARPLGTEATRLTRTGSFVGSLDYIAPEQLRGQNVTGTADVYALACVLYECLTGKVPFPADDPAAKLAAQLNDPPAAPSVFDPRIPPALDMVVATGMDKDPRRRFATAGELMSAAAAALAEVSVVEPAGSTTDATAPGGDGTPGQEALVRAIVSVAAKRRRGPEQPGIETTSSSGAAEAGPGTAELCPYPGLRSFSSSEAVWFHGRDGEITDLLVRLSRQSSGSGPLMVVGASGTGKSSLLHAGLFPVLDEAGGIWSRVVLTPGEYPVNTLATRIAAVTGADPAFLAAEIRERPDRFGRWCRPAAGDIGEPDSRRLMVVVDQFEQVFTDGAEPADREAFATALAHAWPATVVLALRADYIPDSIQLSPLMPALEAPVVVGPLGPESLREVITAPAHGAGLRLEDGLAERLIRDARSRDGSGIGPGTLPRLAHALHETWRNRSGHLLTLSGYEATGGVDRAVAISADQLYGRLGAEGGTALRAALLRLVNVLPDGGLARRRANRADLTEQALSALVDARLVSVDDDGVRLAHDALLTAWPRLRGWVEEDQQDLLLRQRLDESARNWRDSGHDRGDLYRGGRLAAATEWAARRQDLTALEREFLHASGRDQERATRRLRTAAATLATLLVVALVAGGLALNARREADHQARIALSRQLAAESLALAEWDPAGAREAALKAWHAAPTSQARGALLSADALTDVTEFDSGLNAATAVDVSADGTLVAVGGTGPSGNTVTVTNMRTGRRVPLAAADLGEDTVQAVRFSPDGALLAVAVFGDPGVRVWETTDGQFLTALKTSSPEDGEVVLGPLAWHPDGTTVTAQSIGDDGSRMGSWNPRTGAFQHWLTSHEQEAASDAAYSDGGDRLAVGRTDAGVELWNPATSTLIDRTAAHRNRLPPDDTTRPTAVVAFSGSGTFLASASPADPLIRLHDPVSGADAGTIKDRTRSAADAAAGPRTLTFSGDGTQLLTATGANVVVWDPVDRKRLGTYPKGTLGGSSAGQAVVALAASSDSSTVVAARAGGTVTRWLRSAPWYEAPRGAVLDVAFAPDGEHAAAVDGEGALHTWNWKSGRTDTPPRQLTAAGLSVTYAPDGTRITGAQDGTITVDRPRGQPTRLTLEGGRLTGGMALSADGALLAAAGSGPTDADTRTDSGEDTTVSGRVYVWALATGKRLAELDLDTGLPSAVAFSPDGTRLLAVSSDTPSDTLGDDDDKGGTPVTLSTWPTADLGARPTVTGLDDDVTDAVYTSDGESVVTASVAGTIEIRDATTGKLRRTFGEHPSGVRALAMSPDGTTLATATTDDAAVWLWDFADGTLRARLTSGSGFEVNALAFFPDGTALARGGTDAAVALWRLDVDDAVQRLCDSIPGTPAGELGCG
ncbi:nSTAND1 domain-containing NTPase [Streptomyces sp. enrichment culture]|uniref:WD40 repeat domain-containing serine/threonine protein kinase n=1 Tax=Streptomyces sp. enrichment culture TaxID=1795815 RepID=UPI003F558A85